jgi:argininosuccinate synthase
MKSRGIYETPGGTILYEAHNILESATLDKEALHFKQMVSLKYGELIYNGLWYSKIREAIDAFIEETQENVSGSVKMKLYKGFIKPAGIFTENALYDYSISSFGDSELYDHKDAQGFINLFTLPLKIKAMKNMSKENKVLNQEVAVDKIIQ